MPAAKRDVIGRIGAGEFAVLYPDRKVIGSMEAIVERLIDEMMEPYQLSTHLQSVSLSVGIVAMPKDGVDPVLILRRSNLALQNARASGVGNWSVFHPDMGRGRRLPPMDRGGTAYRLRARRLRPALPAADGPADAAGSSATRR